MPLTILSILRCHFSYSKQPPSSSLPHTHTHTQAKNWYAHRETQATQEEFTIEAMRPIAAPVSASTSPGASPPTAVSPWHSPVPYLFGGLAAMLGLIALALLILACSYWKLNNYLGTGHASSSGAGAESTDGDGSKSPAAAAAASPAAFAGLVAVVMAGEKMPTFLAAPVVRRAGTDTPAAVTGDGSPETTEGDRNRGKAEGGVVTAPGGERSQRVDQV